MDNDHPAEGEWPEAIRLVAELGAAMNRIRADPAGAEREMLRAVETDIATDDPTDDEEPDTEATAGSTAGV